MEQAKTIGDIKRMPYAQTHSIFRESGMGVAMLGLASLVAWTQIYQGSVLLKNIPLFNNYLYAVLAHTAILILFLALSGTSLRHLFYHFAAAVGIVAACFMFLALLTSDILLSRAASLMYGAASAALEAAWIMHISLFKARRIIAVVLGGLLAGALLRLACSSGSSWTNDVLNASSVVLPIIASLALWIFPRPKLAFPRKRNTRKETGLSNAFLVILASCCCIGSFFAGLALNPYVIQSSLVNIYWAAFTAASVLVFLMPLRVVRQANIQLFFLPALIGLLIGLYLFSSSGLGSIIMPLGMIIAAQTYCNAIGLIAVAVLLKNASSFTKAKTGREGAKQGFFQRTEYLEPFILVIGLLLSDGMFAQGVGIFASDQASLGYKQVATAASTCMLALGVFYALAAMNSSSAAKTIFASLGTQGQGKKAAEQPNQDSSVQTQKILVESEEELLPQDPAQETSASKMGQGTTTQNTRGQSAAMQDEEQFSEATQEANRIRNIALKQQATSIKTNSTETLFSAMELTERERSIALLILQGMAYRRIGEELDVTERTVKFHASNLFKKAGASNRREFESIMASPLLRVLPAINRLTQLRKKEEAQSRANKTSKGKREDPRQNTARNAKETPQ